VLLASGISVESFVLALCVGAALIAFWIAVTLPRFGPSDLARALLHLFLSVVVGAAIAPGIHAITSVGVPATQYVAAFGIALPALTYMFLAAAWLMRVMRDYFQNPRY
jgi:hypothetical protein